MSIEVIIIISVALILILMFNSLISKKNQVNNAFASIDVYLKKRYDLIPNLVAAVQNYMNYEIKILTEITALRTKAINGNLTNEEKIDINNKLSNSLHQINIAVENYPDIKASTNFLQLQASLNDIEEQLSAARRAYNASVNSYNNAVQMFPTNLFAMLMAYKPKSYFEIIDTERKNIDINTLFNNK